MRHGRGTRGIKHLLFYHHDTRPPHRSCSRVYADGMNIKPRTQRQTPSVTLPMHNAGEGVDAGVRPAANPSLLAFSISSKPCDLCVLNQGAMQRSGSSDEHQGHTQRADASRCSF